MAFARSRRVHAGRLVIVDLGGYVEIAMDVGDAIVFDAGWSAICQGKFVRQLL